MSHKQGSRVQDEERGQQMLAARFAEGLKHSFLGSWSCPAGQGRWTLALTEHGFSGSTQTLGGKSIKL